MKPVKIRPFSKRQLIPRRLLTLHKKVAGQLRAIQEFELEDERNKPRNARWVEGYGFPNGVKDVREIHIYVYRGEGVLF